LDRSELWFEDKERPFSLAWRAGRGAEETGTPAGTRVMRRLRGTGGALGEVRADLCTLDEEQGRCRDGREHPRGQAHIWSCGESWARARGSTRRGPPQACLRPGWPLHLRGPGTAARLAGLQDALTGGQPPEAYAVIGGQGPATRPPQRPRGRTHGSKKIEDLHLRPEEAGMTGRAERRAVEDQKAAPGRGMGPCRRARWPSARQAFNSYPRLCTVTR